MKQASKISLEKRFPPFFLIPHVKLNLDSERPISVSKSLHIKDSEVRYDMHFPCEMGVVIKGKYRRRYQRSSNLLKPGEVWWCGMWEPHGGYGIEEETEVIVIVMLPEFLISAGISSDVSILLPFFKEGLRLGLQPETAKERAFNIELALKIYEEVESNKPGWQTAIRLDLLRMNHQLLRKLPSPSLQQSGELSAATDFQRLLPSFEYIRSNLPSAMTMEEVAKSAHMSRSCFASVFRRTVGKTFAKYVLEIRLEHARRDLLLNDDKIEVVAQRWGFVDAPHLTHHFVRQFGQTPGVYRERRRK